MPTARAATRDDLPAIGRALAAAFADDPIWEWIRAPRAGRPDAERWFRAEAAARLAGHGEIVIDDQGRGAAVWAPPGHWKGTAAEVARLLVPSLRLFRTRLPRALGLETAMARHHLREPHWYLAILGTDPAHQGKGIGSGLITTITDRCDDEGLPAYLESSKEQNVPFYARHGFAVTEKVAYKGSPSLWLMRREPR